MITTNHEMRSIRLNLYHYNKQNCELFYNHFLPDVIDRNIFNVVTLHAHCICWSEIKGYCILMYCIKDTYML